MRLKRWFPIAEWLPNYDWSSFVAADLIAAASVAALLIPQSMGYASVAGVPVQIGLYAAPLALIGYAMFGGSELAEIGEGRIHDTIQDAVSAATGGR